VATLGELDKESKLTESHLSLYEKFCASEDENTSSPVPMRESNGRARTLVEH
jgi:hypothetical protein